MPLQQALTVSAMSETDLDWVCEAEQNLHFAPWSRGNFLDALSLVSSYFGWVMHSEKEPVGYAVLLCVLDEVHLLNISVLKNAHRKGYGAALLRYMTDWSRERGGQQFFLEVRPSNVVAHRLYLKMGFEQIGRRKGYYPAAEGREDALVMRKIL